MNVAEYVEKNEGYERFIYLDSEGIETIGIGFNLQEGFSKFECQLILNYRLGQLHERLSEMYSWYPTLNEVRRTVLLDMAYNLGIPRLSRFVRMISAIEREDFELAGFELLDSRYATQVKGRAVRNAAMMQDGEWHAPPV